MNDFDVVYSYLESQFVYEMNQHMAKKHFSSQLIARVNGIINSNNFPSVLKSSPNWIDNLNSIKTTHQQYEDYELADMMFDKHFGAGEQSL